MSSSHLQRWQRIIVAVHIVLAVLYGIIVPPWEAHDETGHFAYVNQLILSRQLPDARSQQKVFLDQSHQPPLYYLIVAGITFWIDRSDQLIPQTNLFAFDGTNRRGTRILLRNPGEEFPWTGTILALHAARLVSALLSGLMLWFIARATRRLFATLPVAALLATAIAAFNPQVLFMAGMVNNDVMVSLADAALVYCIVNLMPRVGEAAAPAPAGRFSLVGASLALGLWSKNSALILVPFTAFALIYMAWRERWPLRGFIWRSLVAGVSAFVLAFPFYLTNELRYGQWIVDRSAQNPLVQAPTSLIGAGFLVGVRDRWLLQIFVNAFRTFWGTFGWGNVQMPDAIYTLIAILVLIGVIGAILGFRQADRSVRDGLVLMAVLGIAMMLLPGYRAIYYQDPALLPGRYLMPAFAAYASLLGFGWAHLLGTLGERVNVIRHSSFVQRQVGGSNVLSTSPAANLGRRLSSYDTRQFLIATLPLFAFALFVPFAYIAPAYTPPPVQKTGSNTPALLTFEDVAQVMSVSATTTYLDDREGLRHYAHVHMTWRALKRTAAPYAFAISVLGRDDDVLGNVNVQPARGNYPSTNWNPGDTFDDDYYVLLEQPCPSLPTLGHVSVSVYEYQQVSGPSTPGISITHTLKAMDGQNRPVSPIVGRFKIDQPANPIPVFWQPPLGMLDSIALRRVGLPAVIAPGGTLTVSLTYETWQGGNPEGVGFVHLFDERGQRIAQDDHLSLGGAYPTDLWSAGECVSDHFTLHVPITATGTLKAVTGFYSPQDGQRFNTGTPDNLLPIGTLKVSP